MPASCRIHPSWLFLYTILAENAKQMVVKKLNFPLPWRQGMKGGGGDAVNFFYCLTAKYAIEGRIQPG
jgi:hypothetical protein